MSVPDVFMDRDVKCLTCHAHFVPNAAGGAALSKPGAHVRAGHGDRRAGTAAGARPRVETSAFKGIRTDHAVLLRLCEESRLAGETNLYHYLAAYSNARTAIKRDTWQAAAQEWSNAHQLLGKITTKSGSTRVEMARQEFVTLASKQLMRIVDQMHREFEAYNAKLPPRARRARSQKIATAFQNLLRSQHRALVNAAALRQVEEMANHWTAAYEQLELT
jgi:hypothetical protein